MPYPEEPPGYRPNPPAPPRPQRPRPNRRLTIPGYRPDYAGLIRGSSRYQGWKTGADKQRQDAAATRRAAIRNLILQFGGLPGGLPEGAAGDLDPELLALAQGNQSSQTALLARAYQDQLAGRRRGLVSRGMADSGELGHEESAAATWRSNEEYSLRNALMEAVNGALGDYSSTVSGIDAQEQDILTDPDLLAQIREDNPAGTDSTAQLVPGSVEQYGRPVYKSPSGKRYIVGDDGVPIEVNNTLVSNRGHRPGAARRALRRHGRMFRG